MTRIALLDDYQGEVLSLADWTRLADTREAYRGFFTGVVESIDRYLRGEVPARCLNPEARETRS